ncbi:uncharacterized protein N7483_011355 [Penicillium malachiteum]|uniref:uncharacterized protein n=1 Tax=Penicillium malachiteum TaxID=1324776 RepID=UPI002546AAC8|nr:uncharacterized protein N7483_011355 [Penicillium malachiteum]KAJ5714174.1 hypothetical protein N7483_011355 [Penicillium malachiteum]
MKFVDSVVSQDPSVVKELVHNLEEARKMSNGEKKRAFTCKKSTFTVHCTQNVTVDSWKFMDWDYRRPDLPTYARGLFTTRLKSGIPEIAVRGYDKFFNVEEVNDTRWRNIETNTQGPYELSVKENGCIIFIAGLEDDKLLVCSKHSTGLRPDVQVSHAMAGEQWVEHHVKAVNKSTKDLARTLRENNLTAVGELCDDSFEEHVLAYDEVAAGIYLHGLNHNVPQFSTLPSEEVHKFADEWGFKKAKFVTYNKIDDVKQFLEECAETGTWDGRETEGFVVRCKMSNGEKGPVHDWFFKYKFEEPYLMYRQWRECTKAVIGGKLLKIKKHEKITEEYLQFARRQFMKNPNLTKEYNLNHGIISLREDFLKERGLKGSEIIAMEAKETGKGVETVNNVIIAPIASLGCGKTTVALALVHLFGWGHIQNDSIPKQKNKPKKFAFEITQELAIKPVVIADRNSHQRRERKQLMEDVYPVIPNAQFVALHYVHEPKHELFSAIKEVTRKRVLERGDNHQTIRAATKNREETIGIMDGFLSRFEGIDTTRDPDENFDLVIDLDVCASSRQNLETIVLALHRAFPRVVTRVPSAEELDAAISASLNEYKVQMDLSSGYSSQNKKEKPPKAPKADQGATLAPALLARKIEFFQIALDPHDVLSPLHALFTPDTPPEVSRLYNQLAKQRRVQNAFHVTLIHRAAREDRSDVWSHYTRHYIDNLTFNPVPDPVQKPPTLGNAQVRLERLVWDDRVMAFVVRILSTDESSDSEEGSVLPCANVIPHITIGTASADIKPKESNDLLARWLEHGSGGDTGIYEAEVKGVKLVEGTVGLTMMRGKY